jgi:hypothetical protein
MKHFDNTMILYSAAINVRITDIEECWQRGRETSTSTSTSTVLKVDSEFLSWRVTRGKVRCEERREDERQRSGEKRDY